MATTVVKTIGTGGDYSTLQAWEDACPANLVSADQIWQGQCKNQEFVVSGTVLTISGTTVDATHYVELTTEAGASFVDHADKATNALRYNTANGAALRGSGAWVSSFAINQQYTRISKLQFSNSFNGSGSGLTIFAESGLTWFDRCIVEGHGRSITGVFDLYGAGSVVSNCVLIQKNNLNTATIAQIGGASAYNVTLAALGTTADIGIKVLYGATLTNVYVGNAATTFSSANTATNCYTSQSSPPAGWTNAAFSTATFENVTSGTHDLRLKAGSALINAGANSATYSPTDIIGTARTSGAYDVGAWEYVAAGDTTAPTLTSPSVTAVGSTTATGNISTDEGNGTLYSVVSTSATAPNVAQIQAGNDHTGSAAVWAGNQAISSTGAKTTSITGLTASTAYYAHFQHKDAANNNSTVVSSAQFTTLTPDSTNPTMTGSVTISAKTTTSYTATWSAGSDNVAVTGYECRLNAGSWVDLGSVLTVNISARTPGATDTFEVRAYDAAGNRATALSQSITLFIGTITLTDVTQWETDVLKPSQTGVTVDISNISTGALVVRKTGQVTTAGSDMTIKDALIAGATLYQVVLRFADGSVGVEDITSSLT